MPSTFSPNLRIELIGNGEQAGNWGSTTNTNLGTLIEQAISGYVTVSVTTANQAFTYADGVSDQARNAIIELTTTTGAAFNVYAPPSPKLYVIKNASAHAATVYNSTVAGNTTAAGTGVTIPAGLATAIWTDGTNFSAQTSSVPTGAVFYFAMNAAPNGYLEADGTAISRTTYAALFAAVGTTFGSGDGSSTFNLPDLRAEFIRGWDDGRGVDTGRVFGSTQADELKAHKHDIRVRGAVSSHSHRIDGPAETYVAAGSSASLGGSGSIYNDGGAILNTGGTETRPRNVALLACIKT
jgi:microcystin-dependent protein